MPLNLKLLERLVGPPPAISDDGHAILQAVDRMGFMLALMVWDKVESTSTIVS
jgi:hypothetical protein